MHIFYTLIADFQIGNPGSVQALPRLQVPKRAHVGQRKGDAKNVFPPQGAQGKPPELEVKGKATKIITELADHLVGNTLGKVIVHAEEIGRASCRERV